MKSYSIFIAKDDVFSGRLAGFYRVYVTVGAHMAQLGSYSTPRAARKAAKDFIKQIKEAEEGK